MATSPQALTDREIEARYQARLDQEVARLREESRKAVEEFKRSFPPPSDEQIEKLLYPELSEYAVELGGRRFTLRELPALVEKKFLRLVEQKLPALVTEILSFDEHLGDNATQAFTRLFTRAGTALDVVAEACVLVLDPSGDAGVTREFVQQHASTARQLRILKAQLLLNGARDFLSQLFPALTGPQAPEGPALRRAQAPEGPVPVTEESRPVRPTTNEPGMAEFPHAIPGSPPPSVGSNSSASRPAASQLDLPWDNWR